MFEGEKYIINGKKFKVFIGRAELNKIISELAAKITSDYIDKEVVFVLTLKGSIFFAADLIRQIPLDSTMEVISAKSYGSEMHTSGDVKIVNLLPDIEKKHVLIIEDIVDSGLTIETLFEKIKLSNPASLEAITLLSKPTMRKVNVNVKYVGKEIPPEFVIGYGLDFDEKGRQLPDIYVLDEDSAT